MGIKIGNQKSKKGSGTVQWEEAPTTLTRKCVFMSIFGGTGSGRTSLALTAPGPIALIHAAEKLEGVVQPAAQEKEVRLHNFGGSFGGGPNEIAKAASKNIGEMKEAWTDAFSWARTIIVDTHTEAWELLRLARFGTLTPRGHIASMYAPVNAEWSSLLKQFRGQSSTNVILIGQTRERYKNDKATGIMEQAGQKSVPYYSDVIIETSRNIMKKKEADFVATIKKGWWNAHTEGLEIEDEDISFSYLMSLISETEEEEWA